MNSLSVVNGNYVGKNPRGKMLENKVSKTIHNKPENSQPTDNCSGGVCAVNWKPAFNTSVQHKTDSQ